MPAIKKTLYATPQDVENAFYEALARADLDAMMAVWSEDEEIVCVHPGGGRLAGYTAVRDAWAQVFGNGQRLNVKHVLLSQHHDPMSAVHSVLEEIALHTAPSQQAPVVATNVYVRGPHGWRMLIHHASPSPPDAVSTKHTTLH